MKRIRKDGFYHEYIEIGGKVVDQRFTPISTAQYYELMKSAKREVTVYEDSNIELVILYNTFATYWAVTPYEDDSIKSAYTEEEEEDSDSETLEELERYYWTLDKLPRMY